MIVDLFAGPGGWSQGLRQLGLQDVGLELDPWACATRAAAGHRTVRCDVARYPLERFVGRVEGLIASPPCQDFSVAGGRLGLGGERGRLILEVPRWVDALRPQWVACEQVPPALDLYEQFAKAMQVWGYRSWAGLLNAADYGVPQSRKRAFLLARRDGPAHPPEATHCKGGAVGLFGEVKSWVSMYEALGWGAMEETAPTIMATSTSGGGPRPIDGGKGSRARLERAKAAGLWAVKEGDEQGIPIESHDAAVLQGFPRDYPFVGNRTARFNQIGNAVPPPLAAAIIRALV